MPINMNMGTTPMADDRPIVSPRLQLTEIVSGEMLGISLRIKIIKKKFLKIVKKLNEFYVQILVSKLQFVYYHQ